MKLQKQAATRAQVRRMAICSKAHVRDGRRYVHFPIITLSGRWLQDCGFQPGHVIDITCEKGRRVITLSPEQRFERLMDERSTTTLRLTYTELALLNAG